MKEFLESHFTLWDELPKTNGRRETSAVRKFFENVCGQFWVKFDWMEVRKVYGDAGMSWTKSMVIEKADAVSGEAIRRMQLTDPR